MRVPGNSRLAFIFSDLGVVSKVLPARWANDASGKYIDPVILPYKLPMGGCIFFFPNFSTGNTAQD